MRAMQPQTGKRKRTDSTRILSLSGGIFLLLFLSALIVACGGTGGTTDTTSTGLTSSAATTTIHLGDNNTIAVPTQAPYSCVAWATETSPAVNSTTVVGIYA